MITTESEAKKKWCPFVRAGMYGEGAAAIRMIAVNRDPRQELPELAPCLGSGCMAWRVKGELVKPAGSVVLGYCGLAGEPDMSAKALP